MTENSLQLSLHRLAWWDLVGLINGIPVFHLIVELKESDRWRHTMSSLLLTTARFGEHSLGVQQKRTS